MFPIPKGAVLDFIPINRLVGLLRGAVVLLNIFLPSWGDWFLETGKPFVFVVAFVKLANSVFFGLPADPVSVMVTLY